MPSAKLMFLFRHFFLFSELQKEAVVNEIVLSPWLPFLAAGHAL